MKAETPSEDEQPKKSGKPEEHAEESPESAAESSETKSTKLEMLEKRTLPWLTWWLPKLRKSDRQKSCQRIAESSNPRPSYFVLIILSTLIAAYGLVSNSTATVIGAMIVAPLMGPILGLALGLVLGDTRMFRKSLVAEVSGVVLVILAGMFVAELVGVEQIDFSGGEIAGRTRPTLYDLAIGLAAGLAGAYCTVHPGLQASVAGVAIAVALVPPLAVTGLTTAGWMRGILNWQPAFGSFMLFFANFLTIELAGASLFLATGFRHVKEGSPKADFKRTVFVKLILLIATGVFLTGQLHNLLRERYGLSTSRKVLLRLLHEIPGADLDTIEAQLKGNKFKIRAVVGSRSDIRPEIVARFQEELERELSTRMPEVETQLTIRTVSSTYAAATGYLFEPRTNKPDPEQLRHQALEVELRQTVARFPGVSMENFRLTTADPAAPGKRVIPIELTLISPYDFNPRLVGQLETQLNESIQTQEIFRGWSYRLMVRNLIIKNTTKDTSLAIAAPETRSKEEKEEAERLATLKTILKSTLEASGELKVKQLYLRPATLSSAEKSPAAEATPSPAASTTPSASASPTEDPTPAPTPTPLEPTMEPMVSDSYVAQVELRSSKLIEVQSLREARREVEAAYREKTGFDLTLDLEVVLALGSELHLAPEDEEPEVAEPVEVPETASEEAELKEKLLHDLTIALQSEIDKLPGVSLAGIPILTQVGEGQDYRLVGVVTSPKALKKEQLLKWQKSLFESQPELNSLELRLENRLGQTLHLDPSRKS